MIFTTNLDASSSSILFLYCDAALKWYCFVSRWGIQLCSPTWLPMVEVLRWCLQTAKHHGCPPQPSGSKVRRCCRGTKPWPITSQSGCSCNDLRSPVRYLWSIQREIVTGDRTLPDTLLSLCQHEPFHTFYKIFCQVQRFVLRVYLGTKFRQCWCGQEGQDPSGILRAEYKANFIFRLLNLPDNKHLHVSYHLDWIYLRK